MATFNPAKDITQSSLGGVLTPLGKSLANKLDGAFPSLKNGLRSDSSNKSLKAEPLADKRLVASSASSLVFPVDLPDQLAYFKLGLKEYRRQSSTDKGEDGNPLSSIYLPLPSSIIEAFAMQYNTKEFGPVLGSEAGLKTAGDITNVLAGRDPRLDQRASEAKTLGTQIGQSLANFLIRGAARAIAPGIGAAGSDLLQGSTPNPGLVLLFQAPNNFRQFSYSWRLAPESQEENKKLQEIIRTIKYAMHPGKDNLFLSFPYRAFPQIVVKGQNIFDFKPCVITKFDVNYAPGPVPAFFQDGKPVDTIISIGLQETEIFTKDDFKPKGSSNYNEDMNRPF